MTSLAHLPGHGGTVYRLLAKADGAVVDRAALLDALHGVRAWGGPEWRSERLSKAISGLRQKGARIYTYGHQGWALGVAPRNKIRPIGKDILAVLRNASGDIVPYERLIDSGWSNRPAAHRNLQVEIGRLRNFAQVNIKCVRGRGYRLIEANS